MEKITLDFKNTPRLFKNPIFNASYTLLECRRNKENQNTSFCRAITASSIYSSAQKSSRKLRMCDSSIAFGFIQKSYLCQHIRNNFFMQITTTKAKIYQNDIRYNPYYYRTFIEIPMHNIHFNILSDLDFHTE